jgi:hypothetical protein
LLILFGTLQGLFSVSTTSTKSPTVIRHAIVEALDQLGVTHRAIKAGFECAHAPSIDLASVALSPRPDHSQDRGPFVQPESPTPGRKRSLRRGSRMGLPRSPFSKDKDLDKEGHPTASQSSANGEVSQSSLPRNPGTTSSSSFTMLAHAQSPEDSIGNNMLSPPARAGVPAGAGRASQTAMIDVSTGGPVDAQDLIVRFEIFIIKVPWLPGLHGIQFRRISGSAWQYSQLGKLIGLGSET